MAIKQKKEDGIGELIKTVVYALLIAGVVRTLFFSAILDSIGINEEYLINR
ncbi:hypothetical protein N9R24_01500 [Amylibacter sp.]|nr:hypothetical protein [Amylibacter sp.]